jgi:hypothetical protein
MRRLLKFLDHAGWVLAFVVLCAAFGNQVIQASRHQRLAGSPDSNSPSGWICPILGKCGPPGTPGLGRW